MTHSARSGSMARAAVFAPLEGSGRAELVAQRLTDGIVLGVLGNGEKLPTEASMARQWGVATVTAREALEILRDRGLITTRRGRDGGSFVTFSASGSGPLLDERLRKTSRVMLRDLATHDMAIIGTAAELAADRATEANIDDLRRIRDSADHSDPHSCRRAHSAFTLELAALSQSARLVREEIRLQSEFGPLLWLCLRDPGHRERCIAAQSEIVEALEALDGTRARRSINDVITMALRWLLDEKSRLEEEEATP